MEWILPIKGYADSVAVDKSPALTSGDMNNVRPTDTLERRLRMGQRPGLKKRYSQQIGGANIPIVAICSVTVVD